MTTMLKGNREETKKGSKKALVWNEESDRAFEGMKQALLSAVGLHLVDPDRGFVLRTDASDYAVGAVLEQVLDDGRHVPVAFWSRVLAEGQRQTWTPREKEAYAIVMALRKWAGYIALHPVTVCTDHQSLQSWHKEHVDTPSGPASRRARWHETLAKFDLTVVYVPGKDNTVADCIYRVPFFFDSSCVITPTTGLMAKPQPTVTRPLVHFGAESHPLSYCTYGCCPSMNFGSP